MKNMKKLVITSIVMVVLVLGVVVSSIYTDLQFDIGVLVDTPTVYRDINDNKDIPNTEEDQYMYKTVVEGIHIIIPCNDRYTIVRVSKTEEYIEVYRLRDIISILLIAVIVIYIIRFLIRLKLK
jgi:regulator of protease activity HflC (stomatin/prohibitin superfamily)